MRILKLIGNGMWIKPLLGHSYMLRYGNESGQDAQLICRPDSNGHSVKLQHHPLQRQSQVWPVAGWLQ